MAITDKTRKNQNCSWSAEVEATQPDNGLHGPDDTVPSKPAYQFIAALVLGVVLACLGWRSLNYMSGLPIRYDSGCFLSAAFHMLKGKVLYREVLVHKPPVIFFLDLSAIWIGGTTTAAVRSMERLFAVCAGVSLFVACYRMFRLAPEAFLAALLFLMHFSNAKVLEGGNLSEEYASVFTIVGITLVVYGRRPGKQTEAPASSTLAGACFSLAAFTKENFLFSCIPWFAYIAWPLDEHWKHAFRRAICFLAGACCPALLFLVYFLWTGSLLDFLDHISFGLRYVEQYRKPLSLQDRLYANLAMAQSKVYSITKVSSALLWIGFAACLSRSFLKRHRYVPLAIAAAVVVDFWATTLSGKEYGHYYMQLVVSFALMVMCALAFLASLSRRT